MSGGGGGVAAAAAAAASASPLMEVEKMSTAGLGYGIAVAVGILVLVSTVMLASYVCVRVHGRAAPTSSATVAAAEAAGRGRVSRAVDSTAAALDEVVLESSGSRSRDGVTDAVEDQSMAQRSSAFGSVGVGGGGGAVAGAGAGAGSAAGIHEWSLGSGLDDATLETFPKFCYALQPGKLYSTGDGGDGDDDTLCSICLAEYVDGEVLRMLPDCRHSFHATCVDAWLRLHASCPMCRSTSPLPTPVSTPLSELIPLARHPLHGHNYR